MLQLKLRHKSWRSRIHGARLMGDTHQHGFALLRKQLLGVGQGDLLPLHSAVLHLHNNRGGSADMQHNKKGQAWTASVLEGRKTRQ